MGSISLYKYCALPSVSEMSSFFVPFMSFLGILVSLLLANTERKRIRVIEMLSQTAAYTMMLTHAYMYRPPRENVTDAYIYKYQKALI